MDIFLYGNQISWSHKWIGIKFISVSERNADKERKQIYLDNAQLNLTLPSPSRTQGHRSYSHVYVERQALSESSFTVTPMSSTNSLQCSHCMAVLLGESYLKAHISRFHGETMPFSCSQCGRGYSSARGLSHHLQSHKGKTFTCPICDVRFTQKFTIKRHLRVIHMSAQCLTCRRVFKVGREYDQHVLYCGS